MNYFKIYDSIIENAKVQNRKKYQGVYYENHHIVPRCMGGSDDTSNQVLLTAKEHFVCHQLLCEMYDHRGLKFAFWAMCNQTDGDVKRDYRVSSRTYERAKKLAAIEFSKLDRSGEKNSFYGKKHSQETRKRWSEKRKGNFTGEKNSFYGNKHSNESLDKMRASRRKYLETEDAHKTLSMCNQQRKIVYCNELDKEFASIKEAANYFNMNYSTLKYLLAKDRNYEQYSFTVRLAN